MRINRERLRKIVASHVCESEIPLNHMVREKPFILGALQEIMLRGRRRRTQGLSDWHLAQVIRCLEKSMRSLGYDAEEIITGERRIYRIGLGLEEAFVDEYDLKPAEGFVQVKLLEYGRESWWFCVPKDIAQKILLFGSVPNLKN
jgi:hypothetical protein